MSYLPHTESVANLDAIFEHVKGAIKRLETGDPQAALRLLKPILGHLAYHTLKATDADPGSPHWMQLVKAVEIAFPPEPDWKDYVS